MMRQHLNKTVIRELYKEWLKWSIWLFAIIIILRVLHWIGDYFGEVEPAIDHFMYFMNESSPIFMLVVGIMMVFTFLRYYTEHGLTRRTYFIGGAIASLMITITIGVISMLLPVIEGIVLSLFGIHYPEHLQFHSFGYWISYFLLFIITSWLYYIIGWFIGHVFYRYNWWKGIFASFFGFVLVMLENVINGETVTVYGVHFEGLSLSIFTSIIILLLLSAGMLVINYRLVKDIQVKMK
ncbi:hypothetical protein [Virgibacillus salexigens]|nr:MULTISPECIES: hypothetical protein [Virgibacillus]MYL40079.1 hypothetical protein [Virgibacillus massiliensis]